MGAKHKVGEITKDQLIDLYVSTIAFTMPVVFPGKYDLNDFGFELKRDGVIAECVYHLYDYKHNVTLSIYENATDIDINLSFKTTVETGIVFRLALTEEQLMIIGW